MIGKMDRKVTIQFRQLGTGVYGERPVSFGAPVVAWAEVKHRNTGAREGVDGALETSSERVIFLVRYCADLASLSTQDRIVHDGEKYDIENITEVGRNYVLRILCNVVR